MPARDSAARPLSVAKGRAQGSAPSERGAEAVQVSILNADSGAVDWPDGCKTVEWGGVFTRIEAAKAAISGVFNALSMFDSLQRAADCGF